MAPLPQRYETLAQEGMARVMNELKLKKGTPKPLFKVPSGKSEATYMKHWRGLVRFCKLIGDYGEKMRLYLPSFSYICFCIVESLLIL